MCTVVYNCISFSDITCNRQDIENADILNANKQIYKHRDIARYVCKKGYEGNPVRTCEQSGWIGDSQCEGKEVQNNKFSVGTFAYFCLFICFYRHEFKIDFKKLPS